MNFLINVIDKVYFNKKFEKNIIKFGIDSTSYTVHIGHIFLINFIFFLLNKKFKIIIIIGDYTAKIKNNVKMIILNSICLKSQMYNFFGDIKIYFNSIWFLKFNFAFFLKLTKIFNLSKYINKTIKKNIINNNFKINDLIYPLLQAYDSIIVDSNYEIGGRDQLFNIFLGRVFQKKNKQNKQNILTIKLIIYKNKKISKSNILYNFNNNYYLIKKIFFNIKFYIKNIIKKKNFFIFLYNYKLKKKKYINNYYYKNRKFLSFYLKNININKNLFFNLLYLKKIIINKKIIIKNYLLKKKKYNLIFFKINIYDKFC